MTPIACTTAELRSTFPLESSACTLKYGPWTGTEMRVSKPVRLAHEATTLSEDDEDPASTRHATVCVDPFHEA